MKCLLLSEKVLEITGHTPVSAVKSSKGSRKSSKCARDNWPHSTVKSSKGEECPPNEKKVLQSQQSSPPKVLEITGHTPQSAVKSSKGAGDNGHTPQSAVKSSKGAGDNGHTPQSSPTKVLEITGHTPQSAPPKVLEITGHTPHSAPPKVLEITDHNSVSAVKSSKGAGDNWPHSTVKSSKEDGNNWPHSMGELGCLGQETTGRGYSCREWPKTVMLGKLLAAASASCKADS
ncbi:hypothetical protein ACOMHN_027469 [Nucella lapillus]